MNSNLLAIRLKIRFTDLDLKTAKYFSYPDNMIKSYISNTKKELVNNDMLIWLIENGAPLEKPYDILIIIRTTFLTLKLDLVRRDIYATLRFNRPLQSVMTE